MQKEQIAALTSGDDRLACAVTEQIIAESQRTDEWYECFDAFAALLDHPKSLVRNRALRLLAANARWDCENRFDAILPAYLAHVTDEKPITARQCIQALAQVGLAKPQLTPKILACFQEADLSKYRDSMRPLIEKDLAQTRQALQGVISYPEALRIAAEFAEEINRAFPGCIRAVYAIGSLGSDYYRPGQSDIDTAVITQKTGVIFPHAFFSLCDRLEKEGLLTRRGTKIALTNRGFLLSNQIIGELIATVFNT